MNSLNSIFSLKIKDINKAITGPYSEHIRLSRKGTNISKLYLGLIGRPTSHTFAFIKINNSPRILFPFR